MAERIVCRALTGPTGSGKTAFSIRLAEENGWEIACMDSMQVYRGMDIGTAKPNAAERKRVPHHLLDLRDPAEAFSVTEYRDAAERLIRDKWEREGRELLFVGGTGLYLQALMHPMGMGAVPADEELRQELHRLSEEPGGKARLHGLLAELDAKTAARLPEGDVRRVIRAIEVTKATGIPFSEQPDRAEESPFEWRVVSTAMPREQLYERINRRVTDMIRDGLAEEVAGLLRRGVPENAQSMQGLGYKEMVPFLRGTYDIGEAERLIRMGTRHYAKRQMTFQRREAATRYVDVTREDAAEQIGEALNTPGS